MGGMEIHQPYPLPVFESQWMPFECSFSQQAEGQSSL